MPAYNSNFVIPLPDFARSAELVGAEVSSNIKTIDTKELLVAGGEIIFAGDPPDIVEQITSSVPMTFTVILQSLSSQGVLVPYEPGYISEEGPPPPSPVPPTIDSLWANVRAMSNMGYPLGNLPNPIPVQDNFASSLTYNGHLSDPQSTIELPCAGNSVIKAGMYIPPFVTTWKEAHTQNVKLVPINGYILGGDYTFEQFLATDFQYDAVKFSCANAQLLLGRNLGSMLINNVLTPIEQKVKIQTGAGYTAADFTDQTLFEIPPVLTYFHLCIERYGNVVSIYLNGVLKASQVQPLVYPCVGNFHVNARYCGPYRVTAGVARYKAPFTIVPGLFPTSS